MGDFMNKKTIKKNEALMLLGRMTSKLGNIVFDYANSVLLVNMFKNNSLVLAIYQSTESIISIIFNLIGGAIADKGNKKKILIITDILSGILCFIVATVVKHRLIAFAMIVANALLGIISAFNSPTYKSIIREITTKDRIKSYNSIQSSLTEVMHIGGPIVGAFLVGLIGVKGALIFDGFTFILSGLGESFLVLNTDQRKQISQRNKNVVSDIVAGFRYLLGEKKIMTIIIVASFVNFFMSGYNLLVPYTNIMYKEVTTDFYAKLLVAQSLGGILGSIVNAKIKNSSMKFTAAFLLIMGLMMLIVPVISKTAVPILMLVPFFIFAFCVTVFNIRFVTYVQINTLPEYVARVFSIISTVAIVLVPIGSFVMSASCNTSQDTSFSLIGVGITSLSIISYFVS